MPTWGWDASDYDWGRGPMDLAAAARDGIVFFTHKATEGTTIRHVHYGEALNRARAAGIPFLGAYIVVRTPGNGGHGPIQAQVDYALAYLDAATPWWRSTPEFFLQVDTEHWGYDNVHPRYGAEMCSLLRQQTGKWVIHYAPRWAYGDSIPGDDPLWASSYGANPAVPYRQAYPGDNSAGWNKYSGRTPTFLQFGSRLRVGSQPNCDANAFRGSLDELRALITGVGDDMDVVQDYRLKILVENWDPTREQWIAAGGDPKVWDAANARGTARNGVKQSLNDIQSRLAKIESRPAAAPVTLSDADMAKLADLVAARINAGLATAVVDEEAKRLGNG